jgi:hypothetical protein
MTPAELSRVKRRARDLKRAGWAVYPQRAGEFHEDLDRISACIGGGRAPCYEWRLADGTHWVRRIT